MIGFTFFLKGFVALSAQVLLIRELFIVAHGNEFSFGIVFCVWVISGAIGSIISGHIKKQTPLLFLFLVFLEAIWLFGGLAVIRTHQTVFGLNPGEIIDIPRSICLVFLTAGIFNFFQGMRFITGGVLLKKQILDSKATGLVYGWEGAGAMTAGFAFAFVLQKYTDPFQTAGIIMLLNFVSAAGVFSSCKRCTAKIVWLVLSGLLIFSFCYPDTGIYSVLNNKTLMKQWKTKTPPLYYVNTHYGNVTVLKDKEQLSFMVDGCLLFTIPHPDIEWIENVSHFPLLYAKKTNNILIIGAGTKGVIPEILKYNPESIDCVEINPELIEIIKNYGPSYPIEYNSKKVHFIIDDPVHLLRKSEKKWDVVLLDAGFPFSLKTARFYTEEFYALVKTHLAPHGIFYTGLEGSPDYMSQPLADVHRIIYETLNRVFPAVNIVCHYYTGYCATGQEDAPAFSSEFFISAFHKKNIATRVFSEFYIRDKLDEEKKKNFMKMIMPFENNINTLYRPIIIIPALKYWFSLSSSGIKETSVKSFVRVSYMVLIILFLAGIAYFLKLHNRKTKVLQLIVLSAGILSIAWELVYLFVFQMGFGSVYFYLSILTGLFMGGLTAGSIVFSLNSHRIKNPERLLFVWQIIQSGFAVISIALIFLFSKVMIPMAVFFVLMALLGFFSGWEFPLINMIYLTKGATFQDSVSRFYYYDLVGAGAGSILTTTLLVPFLGLITSGVLLFIIRASNGILVWKYVRYHT